MKLIITTILICAVCITVNAQKQSKSDTLVIGDTSIHFIKIGDQIFEIKRSVELKPLIQIQLPSTAWPTLNWDTTLLFHPNFYNSLPAYSILPISN